jgi:hypothetical protein
MVCLWINCGFPSVNLDTTNPVLLGLSLSLKFAKACARALLAFAQPNLYWIVVDFLLS